MYEVSQNRRNLMMMWFDYKKAFDSVPYGWIIRALQLAKVSNQLIMAVKTLMTIWAIKLRLQTEKETLETELIQYNTSVLQGDCLPLNVFVLSLNPLSYLLKQLP